MSTDDVRKLGVRLSRAETIPDEAFENSSPGGSPRNPRLGRNSHLSCNSSFINGNKKTNHEPEVDKLWTLTNHRNRSKLALDTQLDLTRRSKGPCIPPWVVLLLVLLPVTVVSIAALLVFGILPLLSLKPHRVGADNKPVDYSESEDAYIRLLVGVIVGSILLLVLLLGGVAVCIVLRRKSYSVDDGLLDGVALRDGSVTLTRINPDKGEYRVDLSSGELNTTVDVEPDCESPSGARESVSSSQSEPSSVVERHCSQRNDSAGLKRSSVRNSSYKRAVEGRSIYEFQNRPVSVLFDVNKYLNNHAGKPHHTSHGSSGSEDASIPESPSTLDRYEDISMKKRNTERVEKEDLYGINIATTASTLVGSENSPLPSYGTLSRSDLLKSVDDEGYHFDNLGFSVEHTQDDSAFEDFPEDQIAGQNCELGLSVKTKAENSNSQIDVDDQLILDAVNRLEKDLRQRSQLESISSSPHQSEDNSDLPLSREGVNISNGDKKLSKQDSFQGLPDQQSFDKYLSLVRLDSTTSLSPVAEEAPVTVREAPLEHNVANVAEESSAELVRNLDRSKENRNVLKRQGVIFDDTQ